MLKSFLISFYLSEQGEGAAADGGGAGGGREDGGMGRGGGGGVEDGRRYRGGEDWRMRGGRGCQYGRRGGGEDRWMRGGAESFAVLFVVRGPVEQPSRSARSLLCALGSHGEQGLLHVVPERPAL